MQASRSETSASASSLLSAPSARSATQRRSALACLPCRTAKNKCDGVPPPLIVELSSHLETKIPDPEGQDVQLQSEQACTRCARLQLECLWQPSHRTGRPRKRARVQEPPIDVPRTSSFQTPIAANFGIKQDSTSSYGSAPQASGFDNTAAMMMDLLEQSQAQPHASTSFSDPLSSFQFSESDLIALLNESPFDSSRAAIDSDQDVEPISPQSQVLPASLSNQLITSLDQIIPPSCPQPAFQQIPTVMDRTSPGVPPLLPDTPTRTATASRSRNQLSALRARLNPVAQSPPPSAVCTTPVDMPSIVHVGEAREMILRYIGRTVSNVSNVSNVSMDDSVEAVVFDNGLKLYFCGFAKTVPLLGDKAEFETTVWSALPRQNSTRRLLSRVVATLGYLVSTTNLVSQQDQNVLLQLLRSESRSLVSTCLERIECLTVMCMDDVEALALVQALVLMAYDSYGQNQLSDAECKMQTAVSVVLRMRINQMDAPHSDSYGARSAISGAHAESLRRSWWELYLCDLMFNVTTSGRIARSLDTTNLEVAVHTPMDPGFAGLSRDCGLGCSADQNVALKAESCGSWNAGADRQALSHAYDVRIRTCALINECVKVPDDPNEPDFERIRAIDTMLSNIMVVAQRHWANASTNNSASGANGVGGREEEEGASRADMDDLRWANDTRVEVLFTAMTMLHASRIHLHRIAWFHDLTMDFTSCSFKKIDSAAERVGGADGVGASSAARNARRQSMLCTSVTRIVSSADAIMRLVRLDQRMASPSTWTNGGGGGGEADTQTHVAARLPAHWPFLGCCNMVAAFGYVVAVAASGPDESNLPTYGDEIRLFDEEDGMFSDESLGQSLCHWQAYTPHASDTASGPHCLQSTMTTTTTTTTRSFSALSPSCTADASSSVGTLTKRRDAMVWKLRAAISNIGLAESTLAQYASIWPICAVYQHEVSLCRSAIDSTGPTGLQ